LEVHLVDGTYELFRHYYALPSARDENGREVAAVRGVLGSVLGMIKGGVTHVALATDHVIESFRNQLWPGYKTSEGIEPDLLAQFPLLEEVLSAAGVVVWPMVEFEADDALAAAAVSAAADKRVDRVIICTPDKDLAQCVSGSRIVQLNRRTRTILDEAAILQKFGYRRSPFLTTSRSWAIQRMAIQDWMDGAQNRRLRCWPSFCILNPSLRTAVNGA
jgi:5'-3' exonuclease